MPKKSKRELSHAADVNTSWKMGVPMTIEASPLYLRQRPVFLKNLCSHSQVTQDNIIGYKKFQLSNQETLTSNNNSSIPTNVNIFKNLRDKDVLHLIHPCLIQVSGYVKISILYGTVRAFGKILGSESSMKTFTLYGSKDFQTYMIETQSSHFQNPRIKEILESSDLSNHDVSILAKNLRPSDAVILVEKMENLSLFHAKSYLDSNLRPMPEKFSVLSGPQNFLKCAMEKKPSRYYTPNVESSEWNEVNLTMRNMVLGGEGTGKSTLCKYLVNKLLNMHAAVLYMELDIGQGEFTPPGCVAAVLVQEPVLGPNFTHVMDPIRMLHVGNVSADQCSTQYLLCVQDLVQYITQHRDFFSVPWVINTMGYCKGLGVHLNTSCVCIIKPNTVIQLHCGVGKNNFMFDLTSDKVSGGKFNYQFFKVCSVADASVRYGSKRQARDRMMIAYFSRLLTPPHFSLNAVRPYCVPFSAVTIALRHKIALRNVLSVLNGAIVALCEELPFQTTKLEVAELGTQWFQVALNPTVQPCLGLGLVRGIDIEERELYILSPLSSTDMQSVCVLDLSHVAPPAAIFLNQEGVEGPVPYIAVHTDKLAAVPVHRRYAPRSARSASCIQNLI